MMTKALLRTHFRDIERNRPSDRIASASQIICEKLSQLEVFRSARCIGAFLSLPSEVQTGGILQACWAKGASVCVPYYMEGQRMYGMSSFERGGAIRKQKWNVPEPEAVMPVDPAGLDLILVPALAFDRQGVRLGHGGGYYDRLLSSVKRAFRLGLAFHEQLTDQLPHEPHDQPVHAILTEQTLIEATP